MASSSDRSPWRAWRDGARRVNRAPAVFGGVCALTLLVALPLTIVLGETIERHLGVSLAAEAAASGTDDGWRQEFSTQATGLGTTFVPSVAGFAAVLDNLSAFLDSEPTVAAVAAVSAAWLLAWSFLSGGVIDRYARNRPTRAIGFFAACGIHVWRFVRLGLLALAAYGLLFLVIHPWLFDTLYPALAADVTAERRAFLLRAGGYAVFGLLLAATNLTFDYARIRIVVEDRRSATGALLAATRFIRANRGAVHLYLLNAAGYLVLLLAYALTAPAVPGAGVRLWLTLIHGEAYVLLRHYLKLLFYASETSYFQGTVAHAAYTAGPVLAWPESPAAKTILNADSIPS